ncbi:MAG: 2-amino-4-hydroxy-6-hydroxymethyldihydropteridine diphosphokinase [Gammaproteobacteria bacterium]|nr:2-amino-4-hydroxy-6-hydroxymethyldihydropteridine diphosphokinase [Gammaproteobacteria bacterium]MDH3372862.1 2-amino-4-hydroxy-6-hydroxymethyldihydropteridine diphosphokinase [Gammaproteobacteria bacterium]MDH3407935.1 2-amino-4-hydroxy-6-hydroxymethyldihydropteridine diphosphokinase [Gammaproteobacteria bacterium]MDH3551485.1 2-amino-4-hydroxy-6-hydroxymethyldihydropteridine diphosphokinase [Gammaproteobacteria bacterium]
MIGTERRSTVCYIGLGSNLNEPSVQVESALEILRTIPEIRLLSRSPLYLSAPLGPTDQPDYVNAVAKISTTLGARDLLLVLKRIERLRGRKDCARWGPRVLDLDLLVYGAQEIDELHLKVPHPGIAERNFVLLPLRDIAPDLDIPGLGRVADISVNESEPRISRIQ